MKKSAQQAVIEIINKMQEQLASMERKIDSLINRPAAGLAQRQFDPSSRHNDRMRHGHDFRQRNMYKVICADCNKECEIPFKPSPGRPVYCKECFSRRRNNNATFQPKPRNSSIIERDFTREIGRAHV